MPRAEVAARPSPEACRSPMRFPRTGKMIRVLLVDDQVVVRSGLRMRLGVESDIIVVGEAGDAEAALALAPVVQPDVILMDVELPRIDGISATAALRTMVPSAAVVILSIHESPSVRTKARAAGAAAFVGKHEAGDRLPAAIREAAAPRPAARPQGPAVRDDELDP